MKKMDEAGRKLCKAQAELFASSAALTKCSSAVFLRRFMNSSAAERMDTMLLMNTKIVFFRNLALWKK